MYECFGKTLVQNGVLLCSVWAPAQLHCTKINGEMALLRAIQLKHMLLSLNLYLNRQALKFKITSIDKILVVYNNIPESKKIHALLYHLAGISLRVFRASVSKITVIIQDYALRREGPFAHRAGTSDGLRGREKHGDAAYCIVPTVDLLACSGICAVSNLRSFQNAAEARGQERAGNRRLPSTLRLHIPTHIY